MNKARKNKHEFGSLKKINEEEISNYHLIKLNYTKLFDQVYIVNKKKKPEEIIEKTEKSV